MTSKSCAKWIKWCALLAISAVGTIVGAGMIVTGEEYGWLVFLFFGLCTAGFILVRDPDEWWDLW